MEWIMSLVPLALFGGLMALLAGRKGYNRVIWFLTVTLMIPALIVLAFLPFTNKGDLEPGEAARKAKRGNVIGGVLATIGAVLMLITPWALIQG
jgi:hypothetical protein